MKKIILSLGVMALFGASITLSWADRLNYGTTLNGIVAGQPARAADVAGAFNAVKTAIDGCPSDMVRVGSFCIDKYEASVWNAAGDTQYGLVNDVPCANNGNDCSATDNTGTASANAIFAKSMVNVTPSAYVTWFQAAQACANAGKRLPTNAEWQMAATGTVLVDDASTACNVNNGGTMVPTGSVATCVSNFGAFDMVGNTNEYVADWIQGNGTVNNNTAANNTDYGMDLIAAGNSANQQAGSDGMPSAIVRGGSSATGANAAGVFFFLSNGSPALTNNVTGFRCAL